MLPLTLRALICPWASRTLIGRKLKRLDDAISVSVVEPMLTDQGWRFGDYPGSDRDTLNGAAYLHEIYTRADPGFTGRATVPVLWDKKLGAIVSNESADILRMMNGGFGELADASVDLYPAELREAIFNRFHSVRPKSENFGRHSGLGLAIARAIVEGHDGEIDVEDRDDAPSGARFTITLPAADLA